MRLVRSANTVRRKNRGFTLFEVLVAVIVLSVGLLGLAAMYISLLRNNQNSYLRTQAAVVAYDIVDRMRANPVGVSNGEYNNIDSASLPDDPACIVAGCTTADLADYDVRDWSRNFVNVDSDADYIPALPSASGTVTRSGDVFTVTVNWIEMGSDGETSANLSINFRP